MLLRNPKIKQKPNILYKIYQSSSLNFSHIGLDYFAPQSIYLLTLTKDDSIGLIHLRAFRRISPVLIHLMPFACIFGTVALGTIICKTLSKKSSFSTSDLTVDAVEFTWSSMPLSFIGIVSR